MKKFTFVYNTVWDMEGVEHKCLIIDKAEGQDMKDAIYNHWQMTIDEDITVEDVRIFEGDLTATDPHEVMSLAYYTVRDAA